MNMLIMMWSTVRKRKAYGIEPKSEKTSCTFVVFEEKHLKRNLFRLKRGFATKRQDCSIMASQLHVIKLYSYGIFSLFSFNGQANCFVLDSAKQTL